MKGAVRDKLTRMRRDKLTRMRRDKFTRMRRDKLTNEAVSSAGAKI
jgi:hypothetical protein